MSTHTSEEKCFRCGESHQGYGCPRDFKPEGTFRMETSKPKGAFWYCSCRHPNTPVYYADEMDRLREALEQIKVMANAALMSDRAVAEAAIRIATETLSNTRPISTAPQGNS